MGIDLLQRNEAIVQAVLYRCARIGITTKAAYLGAKFAVDCYWADDERDSAYRAIELGVIHARYRNTIKS